MKHFHNFLMFVSSFIPLYFLIIVKELMDIINGNLTFNITNSVMLSLNLLLIVLGSIGVIQSLRTSNFISVEIIECENITCDNFLPYFPIFVLFAIAFELEFISMAIVYALILIMIGIVYLKNGLFYINPFLNILGYSSYLVSYRLDDKIVKNKRLFAKIPLETGHFMVNNFFIKEEKDVIKI